MVLYLRRMLETYVSTLQVSFIMKFSREIGVEGVCMMYVLPTSRYCNSHNQCESECCVWYYFAAATVIVCVVKQDYDDFHQHPAGGNNNLCPLSIVHVSKLSTTLLLPHTRSPLPSTMRCCHQHLITDKYILKKETKIIAVATGLNSADSSFTWWKWFWSQKAGGY